MAFTLDPQTEKITFGAVADGTHDAIARDIASVFGVSETFNDDFTTDQFTDVGSGVGVNTGTQVIDWTSVIDGTNNATVFDLGAGNVSDTEWVLRFKYTTTSEVAGSGTGKKFWIGLFSGDETVDSATVQDAIAFFFTISSGTPSGTFSLSERDGVVLDSAGTNSNLTTTPTASDLHFIELKRTSSTNAVLTLFSDASYTTVIETTNLTIPSTLTNLRFIGLKNRNTTSTTGGMTGTIDDIQFWNGITVPVITSNNWRMRFTLDITALSLPSTNDLSMWIGLFDEDETSDSTNLQDSFQLSVLVDQAITSFATQTADNQAPRTATTDKVFAIQPSVNTFFVEMIRNSETETTVNFYTDNTYTVTSESETQTGITGTSGLKYLKLFNDVLGNNANTMDGTFDDFTFTDLSGLGTEETFLVDALIKSLGDNSSCITNYVDDFTSDRFVDFDATFISVNTGGERMEFDAQTDNTNDASASDISLAGRFGNILPSTWRIRFSISFTTYTFGNNNHMMFSIGDEDQTTNSRTSLSDPEMSIGFHAVASIFPLSNNRITGYHKDGTNQINTATIIDGGTTTMTGIKYYQMERTSDTSVTYSIFSDAGFTTLINSITQTIPNLTGLQYFKVSNWRFDNSGEGNIIGSLDDLEILGVSPDGTVGCLQVDAKLSSLKEFTVDAVLKATNSLCGIDLTDLKAYWNFDESSGVLVNQATSVGSVDSLGTSADGTVGVGIDRNVTGQVGDSYEFEGLTETQVGNKIIIGSSTSQFNFMHTQGSVGTFNFWINPRDNTQTFADLFINENNTGGNRGMFIGIALGKIQVRPRNSADLLSPITTTNSLTPNVFNMVTVVWDETTGADIYFNGVFEETFSRNANTASSGNANHPLTIGARTDSQVNVTFDGFLDESTAWSRKLNSNEISNLFALGNGGASIQEGGAGCFTIDAIVKEFDKDEEFEINAILYVPPAKLFLVQGITLGIIDKTFTVDSCIRISTFVNFEVDACIQQNNNETTFDVDGHVFILPVRNVLVDAIVRYAQGTSLRGGIPDLIIRALRENPPSLTGRGVVDKVVEITTADPTITFTGKTSRIKNWLNRLRLDNLIQEDGSDPDWFETNWSLV